MTPRDKEAVFEAVRALIETRHPGCRVVEIKEYGKATYQQRLVKAPEDVGHYVLARMEVEFEVEAISLTPGHPGYDCKVALLEGGGLRIINETPVIIDWK